MASKEVSSSNVIHMYMYFFHRYHHYTCTDPFMQVKCIRSFFSTSTHWTLHILLPYNIHGMVLLAPPHAGSTQSFPCLTASGDNCTSSICPNTVVTYTCIIPSASADLTDWTLPTGTCPSNIFHDKIRLSQYVSGLCAPLGSSTCGPYTASSLPPSDATYYCLSFILTVNITAAMNGNTVTCNNTNVITPWISTVVSLATINVVGTSFIAWFVINNTSIIVMLSKTQISFFSPLHWHCRMYFQMIQIPISSILFVYMWHSLSVFKLHWQF